MTDNEEQWDLEIKPKSSILYIDFAEIWRYRDLMLLFVRRDFVALYKQTILGPVWHFIQPILTSIMFLIVFSRIAKLPTDGIHPIVFYLSGVTLWNYFSVCLNNISNTFVSNANIFGKVYFPRIVTPLSILISNLVKFGIQFLLLITTMIWFSFNGYPISISFNWLLIPFILLLIGGITLGLGIIVSSLTTKYRDFTVLLTFAVQLLMYGTPIVYPLSYLKQQGFGWIVRLNPLTPIVESFRYALFGKGTFTYIDILYSFGFMMIVLFIGVILFNKIEKSFIDTV
ncbi:ABC transporter permease [Ohtaekwangia sp.]|uniref:ABC transporter permease n=1 Tax=Ohtaekwangia sp. TaxID=2066019 RepID=UPI002F93C42A